MRQAAMTSEPRGQTIDVFSVDGSGKADFSISGLDLAVDFDADADKIDLTGSGSTGDLSDLLGGHGDCHGRHFGHDDDVVLDLGNRSMIMLLGVSASELTAGNVLL
jgi:hypothetical protein